MKHLFFLFAILPFLAFTQPTINGSQYFPEDGTILSMIDCGAGEIHNIQINNTGEDVTWDFSELCTESPYSLTFDTAEGSIYEDSFPNANKIRVEVDGNNELIGYLNLSENKIEFVGGYVNEQTSSYFFNYFEGLTFIEFPATYESNWSDEFGLSIDGSEEFPGTINSIVDGYGTLILPNRTFENVIRIHQKITFADSNFTSPDLYQYISKDYQFNLLETDGRARYQVDPIGTTSIINNYVNNEIKVSPNPTYNPVNLKIEFDTSKKAAIELYSANGQKVFSKQNVQFLDGIYNLDIESIVDAGFYFIRIKIDDIITTRKIIIW